MKYGFKKSSLYKALLVVFSSTLAFSAGAWDQWDEFSVAKLRDGRVLESLSTPGQAKSENQGYALFFALVAGDKGRFHEILDWTRLNIGTGSSPVPAAAQFGVLPNSSEEGILDPSNDIGADVWIIYSLLEAGRLWDDPNLTRLGQEALARLKAYVQTVPGVGMIPVNDRERMESDGRTRIYPAKYPPFIFKRFEQEDPFFKELYNSSIRAMAKLSPDGILPDWGILEVDGTFVPGLQSTGTSEAMKGYLWASMLSEDDPNYRLLKNHFSLMNQTAKTMIAPPVKTDLMALAVTKASRPMYGVSFYSYLGDNKSSDLIRRITKKQLFEELSSLESFFKLFGRGFDEGKFRFDDKGFLLLEGFEERQPSVVRRR